MTSLTSLILRTEKENKMHDIEKNCILPSAAMRDHAHGVCEHKYYRGKQARAANKFSCPNLIILVHFSDVLKFIRDC